PTAIPFDIVRVGDRYGTVFEHLNAESASDYIKRSAEHFDDFLRRSVELMKQVHSIEAEPGELPDMKQQTLGWMPRVQKMLPAENYSKLSDIVESVPECHGPLLSCRNGLNNDICRCPARLHIYYILIRYLSPVIHFPCKISISNKKEGLP
ncbi:MAG: hypothetical protein K6F90_08755, partial [Lachnospiraceae bacterium]|nr:hypothetical protein [Lachnospiraceae bacterium]